MSPPSLSRDDSDALLGAELDPKDVPAPSPVSPVEDNDEGQKHDSLCEAEAQQMGSLYDKAKEKKKRSRVTPAQLAQLEQFFAVDRSPTATRRKEISQALGMPERQTQIWFQNRRAKAKLQDAKPPKSKTTENEAPGTLSNANDFNLYHIIRDETPVRFIPCKSLTIGTWRRIAVAELHPDLIAYVCESSQCLTWFIQSDGWSFKMTIPLHNIIQILFMDDKQGSGILSFHLSETPHFYLKDNNQESQRGWKRCDDWTEGCQASKIMQHDLSGEASKLVSLQQYILQMKSVALDNALPKSLYQHIPSTLNAGLVHVGNYQENWTPSTVRGSTGQFIVESYGAEVSLPYPPHSHQPGLLHYQATAVPPQTNYVIRDTMIPRFQAGNTYSVPQYQPEMQFDGRRFDARSGNHFIMGPNRHHERFTWPS